MDLKPDLGMEDIPSIEEIEVDEYFTKEELSTIGDYEKKRYKSIKLNYLTMLYFGMPVRKPEFMNGPRRRKPMVMPVASDSEEEDWTPSLARKKEKEKLPPGPMKFVPPKKPVFGKKQFVEDKEGVEEKPNKRRKKDSVKTKKAQPSCTVSKMSETGPTTGTGSISTPPGATNTLSAAAGATSPISTPTGPTSTIPTPPGPTSTISTLPGPSSTISMAPEGAENKKIMRAGPPDGTKKIKKSKDQPTTASPRYPRRSLERKNYKELEVPDDDIFLFCEECQEEFPGDCPFHGPLLVIKDQEVPLTKRVDPDHAKKTTPQGLTVTASLIPGAGLGVISEMNIREGTRFGPYGGEIVYDVNSAQDSGYSWQIFKDDKAHHYVDANNPAKSNWMRYCNCARTEAEQNLVAFQFEGQIYYKTIQPIKPGDELLVFYGESYAKELGIEADKKKVGVAVGKVHPYQREIARINPETGNQEFRCPFCILSMAYKTPNVLLTHVYKKHLDMDPKLVLDLIQDLYEHHKIFLLSETDQAGISDKSSGWKNRNLDEMKASVLHDDDNSYKCKQCDKEFTWSDDVLKHTPLHANEKPDKCMNCDKRFASSGSLQKTGETPYKCEHCNKGFNVISNLQKHMRMHAGEKPYKCEHCDKGFIQSGDLQTHMRIHSGEKPFKCEHCAKGFSHSCDLQRHMRIHSGEKPFKCEHCDKGFIQSGHLQTHMRIHTGEKPFKCEHCDKGFIQSGDLQRHMRIHSSEKPFKCEHCYKGFNGSCDLQRHMRIHSGEKPFKCEHCDKGFIQSGHLQTHMRIHTGEKPFKCEHCDKGFIQSGDLQRHMRIHTGEKPFKCEHCDKGFNRSSTLQTHMRIHTGEKPFKCEHCDKGFIHSGHLQTHMRIHTGEKPFKCEHCDKGFNRSGNLQTHMRIHTGEKPFKCELCGKSFSDPRALSRHKKTRHKEQTVNEQ